MEKQKKKKSWVYNVIMVLCAIIFVGAVGIILYLLQPEIEEYLNKQQAKQAVTEDHTYDWDALRAINPDIVGWIWIPDTVVDYPVVQTTNNEYYLWIGFDRNPNKYGTIFLDCDFVYGAVPKMQNSVLYGHSNTTSDRQMFASLKYYLDKDYLDQHPLIYYTRIEDGNRPVAYEVVDILKVESTYNYRRSQFQTQEAFLEYYAGIHADSVYDTGKSIQENDEVLTLSTCVFDMNDGRLAIICRRI